jgi:hypothetical protein
MSIQELSNTLARTEDCLGNFEAQAMQSMLKRTSPLL